MSQKENYPSIAIDVESVASDEESVSLDMESVEPDVKSDATDMESVGIHSSLAGGLIYSNSFSICCNINNNINYIETTNKKYQQQRNNNICSNIINNKEATSFVPTPSTTPHHKF